MLSRECRDEGAYWDKGVDVFLSNEHETFTSRCERLTTSFIVSIHKRSQCVLQVLTSKRFSIAEINDS